MINGVSREVEGKNIDVNENIWNSAFRSRSSTWAMSYNVLNKYTWTMFILHVRQVFLTRGGFLHCPMAVKTSSFHVDQHKVLSFDAKSLTLRNTSDLPPGVDK